MTDQRQLFEAAVVARLKESGFLEVEIRTECLVRCGDGYQDEVINAGWHYWNAALSAQAERGKAVLREIDLVTRFPGSELTMWQAWPKEIYLKLRLPSGKGRLAASRVGESNIGALAALADWAREEQRQADEARKASPELTDILTLAERDASGKR